VLAYYILTLRQRGALLESQASQIQVINESFATLQSELRQRDALLESQVSQIQVINENFATLQSELRQRDALLESQVSQIQVINENLATLQSELRQIRNNNEIWTESLGSFLFQGEDGIGREFFNKEENFYLDGKPWRRKIKN
jgi:chromosome segregation ATPase